MKYLKHTLTVIAFLSLTACSNPKEIVLGSEPLKELTQNADTIRKLPEDERNLLLEYVASADMVSAFGDKSMKIKVSGKTVGEVIEDAKLWKQKKKEIEESEKKRKLEEEQRIQKQKEEELALAKKVEEANKIINFKISQAVTVSVLKRTIRKRGAYEFEDFMLFDYAVENKSDQAIKLIKGSLLCVDLLGEKIGDLSVTFDQTLKAKSITKTDTGSGWRVRGFGRSELEEIADHSWDSMKCSFNTKAVAFEDGSSLKQEDPSIQN